MEKRKASRTLNLIKPAPRKTNLNGLIKYAAVVEEACTVKTEPGTVEKENRPVGKRATRGLKLEKPAPLKASKSIKDETALRSVSIHESVGSSGRPSEPCCPTTAMDVQERGSPERGETLLDAALPHSSAERKATVLIKEALADMDVSHNSSKPRREINRQTRLLSQVSDDSGVGDMSWYSRQGSILQSLSENQDDLDWGDIDDSAETTFSLSSKQMACLPSAVNQAQSFNSLIAHDDILGEDFNADLNGKVRLKRGRINSYQNKRTVNRNPNISRSYSVPADLSNSNNNNNHNVATETEFWDDEADFSVNNSYINIEKSNRVRNLSEQNYKGKVEDGSRKRHATAAGNYGNGGDSCNICDTKVNVIADRETRHSTSDFSTDSELSFSEDWETDIIDVDVIRSNPSTPVLIKNSGNNMVSAINGENVDPDATPRAESILTKLSALEASSTELFNTEPGKNIQSGQNCDTSIEIMKHLPSYQNYRDKKESDISSSDTKSLKDTDDYLSQRTSEELNEQEYAWELIEDLSTKVGSLKLDSQSSDKETVDFLDKMALEDSLLPLDIDAIEAELEFMTMREDLDLSESMNSNHSKYINSVLKPSKSACAKKVVVTREPLNPHSSQEEVWLAEEDMPAGLCTAKGRRGMFRYHRHCQIDDRKPEKTVNLLQYSAEELLKLGTTKLCKQWPDTWPYLMEIYPDICLEKVSGFDAEMYALERYYVVEAHIVIGDSKNRKTDRNFR